MKRSSLTIVAVLVLALAAYAGTGKRPPRGADEPKSLVNVDQRGVALQGYDPVAFFSENKPVKGDARYTSVYRRATYRFGSPENKAAFDADPAKYEPAFGGYCGYAASINKIAEIDVNYFQILNGRLVLQHNRKAWDLWTKDVPGNLTKADANWAGLVEKYGD
jgi:YHS domain-containing protein